VGDFKSKTQDLKYELEGEKAIERHIYINISVCVCVCVCMCERVRECV